MEAQSYSLTLEDRVSVEDITKHIASVQQAIMQSLVPFVDALLFRALCRSVLQLQCHGLCYRATCNLENHASWPQELTIRYANL